MDRIIQGQAYQQEMIDKIKGIEAKTMPKEWYDYRVNKIDDNKETDESLEDEEIVSFKKKNLKILRDDFL